MTATEILTDDTSIRAQALEVAMQLNPDHAGCPDALERILKDATVIEDYLRTGRVPSK